MTDYEKLTVVKLREELVKRGLPKSGLKAVLAERLVKADAQAVREEPSTPPAQQEPDLQTANGEHKDVAQTALPTVNAQEQDNGPAETTDIPASTLQEEQRPQEPILNTEATHISPIGNALGASQAGAPQAKPTNEEVIQQAPNAPKIPHIPAVTAEGEKVLDTDATTGLSKPTSAKSPKEEPVAAEQLQAKEQTPQDTPALSTQTSTAGGEELRVDTNKRKRRSQSPPLSSVETSQKRTKAEVGRPQVTLPEDETNGTISKREVQDASMEDAPVQLSSELHQEATQTNDLEQRENQEGSGPIDATEIRKGTQSPVFVAMEEKPPAEVREPTPPPSVKVQSPLKPSPTDTRFKNLFATPSKREVSPTRQAVQAERQDRVVSPAVHPATSALYIRDFMRPLNSQNLRDYLTAIASPPDTDPESDVITEFFLDSVRTHCLVSFATTAAASRVRLCLHDRVWPHEKNRKPLWVDFVPEEKLKKWIDVETEAASDRRQGMKKWEVVYEEEDGGIMAYLQEVGPNSSAPRSAQAALPPTESGAGVQGAPTGPRSRDADSRPLAAKSDRGKAFGALDDLFSSTAAKPKLYYLPVSKEIVDKRLDRLAEGRGGGRGDETRRYSFEDGTLVDKGPEFGMRGRGGFGGRGGANRGYGGRGGSYRGDAWRR